MAPPHLPSDQRDVVAAHKHDTVLHVVAGRRPCATWLARVRAAFPAPKRGAYGRRVQCAGFDAANGIDTATSWALVILLCPGDDLAPVAKWAGRLPNNQLRRIRILLHPSAQDAQLEAWNNATGTEAKATKVPDANRLIQEAAAHLNHVTYPDFASSPVRGLPPA